MSLNISLSVTATPISELKPSEMIDSMSVTDLLVLRVLEDLSVSAFPEPSNSATCDAGASIENFHNLPGAIT